jgi:hypothetical protein
MILDFLDSDLTQIYIFLDSYRVFSGTCRRWYIQFVDGNSPRETMDKRTTTILDRVLHHHFFRKGCSAALPFFGTALFLKTPWKLNTMEYLPGDHGLLMRFPPLFWPGFPGQALSDALFSAQLPVMEQQMNLFTLRTHEDSEILGGWDQVRYFLFSKLSTGNASLVSCDSKKAHVPRHLSSAISTSYFACMFDKSHPQSTFSINCCSLLFFPGYTLSPCES